jgi:hypothetical protein
MFVEEIAQIQHKFMHNLYDFLNTRFVCPYIIRVGPSMEHKLVFALSAPLVNLMFHIFWTCIHPKETNLEKCTNGGCIHFQLTLHAFMSSLDAGEN